MVSLYNIFIFLYRIAVAISALWNVKAKEWLKGRKNLFTELENAISPSDSIIWIHSSSAGEFEQAKPVIESLKKNYPLYKILVSFFSPSGYVVGKRYKHADYIFYLPVDTPSNAKDFLDRVRPQMVIFVKYDYWYHHLQAIYKRRIPLLLISAVYRENQIFFKWYGSFYWKMLFYFKHIFVQDEASFRLLKKSSVTHCSISGDTRFDRVVEIAETHAEIPLIAEFVGQHNEILVAGSTWAEDERILKEIAGICENLKIVLAPHEINREHIRNIQQHFPDAVLFSQLNQATDNGKTKVLIIDNIGMLSRLYQYASITYIGGGFTKDGIHNTLEAAVYGKPVFFGPNYKKYREAIELIHAGGAFSFTTAEELKNNIKSLLSNKEKYRQACISSRNYIDTYKGATEKVMAYIQEKRLLTN